MIDRRDSCVNIFIVVCLTFLNMPVNTKLVVVVTNIQIPIIFMILPNVHPREAVSLHHCQIGHMDG